jgi:hypothetical protein
LILGGFDRSFLSIPNRWTRMMILRMIQREYIDAKLLPLLLTHEQM